MSLRSLSDNAILARTIDLTRRERKLAIEVLLHLNEIERRKLHLKSGYASMFAYCTEGLGYSASAAARRIRTARCLRRFSEVQKMLEANQVNLCTISMVSGVLTAANSKTLLRRIRGRSQREVEAIVAEYAPRVMPRDRVRTVTVRMRPDTNELRGETAPHTAPQFIKLQTVTKNHCRSGSAVTDAPVEPACLETEKHDAVSSTAPDAEDAATNKAGTPTSHDKCVLFSFAASPAFLAKVQRIKTLAWHRLPANATLEQVFELAMDTVIEREAPEKRRERREKRRARTAAQGCAAASPRERTPARGGEPVGGSPNEIVRTSRQPRYIPPAVRDEVFARDRGRCAYVGTNGRACGSTRGLQVDHVRPVALGGEGTAGNLRLLCAHHNRLEAERLLGAQAQRRRRALPQR